MSVNRSDSVFDNGYPIAWMWPEAPWPQFQYDSQSGAHTTATGGPNERSVLNEIPATEQILIDDNGGEYYIEVYNTENYHLPGGTYTANNANTCNTGAVVDGVLYFVDRAGNSYAINSSDASEKWVNTPTETGDVYGNLVVDNGVAYWGDTNGFIRAVNTSDGSQKFLNQIFPSGIRGKVSIWEDTLVACDENGRMAGVNATDGSLIWGTSGVGIFASMTPAIMDGVAYVGSMPTESNPESVIAVDVSNGTILWEHGSLDIYDVTNPVAVHPDAIIAADNNGTIWALDPGDGSVLWNHTPPVESNIWVPPVIAQDIVYNTLGDLVHAYQIEDGTRVFVQQAQNYTNGALTPFAGELYYPYSAPM